MPTISPIVFQLHREGGRDPALAIIGLEEAFEKLAYQINDTLNARKEPNNQWGGLIATCEASEIGIPNSTIGLTFTLTNETCSSTKSWRPAFGNAWSLAVGIIGIVAIGYVLIRILL